MITLRAKRDMAPGTRLLFLALGKVRGVLAPIMRQVGKDMGSNGLGGDVYVLRSAEDPVQNSESEPPRVVINFFPDQFAEFHATIEPHLQ
eukprot:1795881-Pyramimonas_sp.AAC.1